MREEDEKGPQKEKPPKRRRWLRRLGILFLILVAFLAWLSGPGIRWLGPKIASHFLSKAGFEGSFELGGNLLGGLEIKQIDLAGDSKLSVVQAGSIRPLYQFSKLVKGQVDGVEIDGLHLELQLDAEGTPKDKEPEKEDKGPADLRKLVETIRSVRGKVLPATVKLDDLSLDVDLSSSLAWIDVQGYEGFVLAGAQRLTAVRTPLVIEFWPYGLERAGSYSKLVEALAGYERFAILGKPAGWHPISHLSNVYKMLEHTTQHLDLLVV